MNVPDRLTIITHQHAGSMGDLVLVDAAGFYGVNSESFDLDRVSLNEVIQTMARQPRPCAAIAADTLVHLKGEQRLLLRRFVEQTPFAILLIHSIQPEAGRGVAWLKEFLDAEVSLTPAPEDRRAECCFSKKRTDWTGPLTGATIGRLDPENDSLLQIGRGSMMPFPLLTPGAPKVGGEMIFGSCRLGDGSVYVLSSRPPGKEYLEEGMAAWLTPGRVTRVLPMMLFIRGVFGASCWHQPRPHAAFVWLDARLSQRRHDIDLRDVAEAVFRFEQHVCLATPAAEFSRFDPVAARLLRQYLNHFSVAPYGNSGAKGELAVAVGAGGAKAIQPAPQSLRRMSEFGRRAKMVWSKAMVAPGETWEASQLRELRECGYRMLLGAPAPRDGASPWKAHEGLEPASLDWPDGGASAGASASAGGDSPASGGGLPVVPILREGGPEQAAINGFLGKPVLFELRPEWFASGAGSNALAVMEQLAAMEVKPVWSDLEKMSRSLYLMRRCSPLLPVRASVAEIRMFSDEVIVEGIDLSEEQVEVIPPAAPSGPFERVALDGAWEGRWFSSQAGPMQFEILGETTLRILLRRATRDVSGVPLGDKGLGVARWASNLAHSLVAGWRNAAARRRRRGS